MGLLFLFLLSLLRIGDSGGNVTTNRSNDTLNKKPRRNRLNMPTILDNVIQRQ